jgi:WXG100 family type VII secretion target
MTADIIQSRYDELDRVAARFGKASAANAELHRRIARCVEVLERGGWQGRGADAFFAEMRGTLYPAMQRLVKALDEGRAVTTQVKDILRAAEEEAAALFSHSNTVVSASVSSGNQSESGGVFGFIGDLFEGAGAELSDMAHGIGNLIVHPIDTVKGLWYGVNHPSALWDAFKKPYVEDWENGHPGRSIGRGILFAGSLLLGTKGADKALKATSISGKGAEAVGLIGEAGRVGRVGETAGAAGRVGDIGEAAGAVGRVGETGEAAGASVSRVVRSVDEVSETILRESSETVASRQELLTELANSGLKHNPGEIVRITRDPNGRIVFLETGKTGERASGLKHILQEHADDFAKQGIESREIPDYLVKAVEDNNIVGYQGRGRPIYEFTYNGERRRVAISIGENGYIVGANPSSFP